MTNYFSDRSEAGTLLAEQLGNYKTKNTVVIALSEGAVVVGAEIAKSLHCSLFILATQEIDPDGQGSGTALSSGGAFSYNTGISLGGLEEDAEAYRFFTSKRNMDEFQKLNRVCGKDGTIPKQMLKRHNVILVSDGLRSALSLEVAAYFMHGLDIKKLIIATTVASGQAIDKMHILVDQIICLRSVEDFISTAHYYEKDDVPDPKTVVNIMQNIVLNW